VTSDATVARATLRRDRIALGCVALIVAAGIAAYANGVTDRFVGFNAQRSLVDNPDIRSLWPLDRAMGLHLTGQAAEADGGTLVRRPLLSLSFALNYVLLGAEPWGFHLVNIAIHLCAALFLFGVVRRILSLPLVAERWGPAATEIATAVALLWVVHPLQTESVTYVIQRAESLASMFALATLYFGCRYLVPNSPRTWAVAAFVSCALAFLTKESVVALPLLVLLIDWLLVSRSLRAALRTHPVFLLSLASLWVLPLSLVLLTLPDVYVDFRPGRTLPYLLAQPRVLFEYVRLAFWPEPLYLYTNSTRFTEPGFFTVLIFGGGVLLALWGAVRGILRAQPRALLPASFFLLLAPTSSFVATNDVIQEHRIYLALAALICGALLALHAGIARIVASARMRRGAFAIVVAPAAIALGLATHARNDDYREEFAVYYPSDLSMAHGALARHAAAHGRLDEAIDRYRELLELPDEAFGKGLPARRFHRGRANNDLGAVLADAGRLDDARAQFEAARRTGYDLSAADNNLAVILALDDDLPTARSLLRGIAAPLGVTFFVANNIGAVEAALGATAAARASFDRALEIEPRFEFARKSRNAVDAPFKLGLHRIRGYSDPWLLLALRTMTRDDEDAPTQ